MPPLDPALRGHWNHNTHYYPLTLRAAPTPCDRALDIGRGDGLRLLASRGTHVQGIDSDAKILEGARTTTAAIAKVEIIDRDAETYPSSQAPSTW